VKHALAKWTIDGDSDPERWNQIEGVADTRAGWVHVHAKAVDELRGYRRRYVDWARCA
jgi:hypothetical protein